MKEITKLLIAIQEQEVNAVRKLLPDCDINEEYNWKLDQHNLSDNESMATFCYNWETPLSLAVKEIKRNSSSLYDKNKLDIFFMLLNNGANPISGNVYALLKKCEFPGVKHWLSSMLKFEFDLNRIFFTFDSIENNEISILGKFLSWKYSCTPEDFITTALCHQHNQNLEYLKEQITSNFELMCQLSFKEIISSGRYDKPSSHIKLTKFLVRQKLINLDNINSIKDKKGNSLLDRAADLKMYDFLIDHGAKHSASQPQDQLNKLLYQAVKFGKDSNITKLLDKGANPLVLIPRINKTALEYAWNEVYSNMDTKSKKVLETIILHGSVLANTKLAKGEGLLNFALTLEIYQKLKSQGAILSKDNNKCLELTACQYLKKPTEQNYELLEQLFKDGINPNVKDQLGYNPLIFVTLLTDCNISTGLLKNYKKIVKLFKDKGADIENILHAEGDGINSEIAIIKILMEHGAKFNFKHIYFFIKQAIIAKDHEFITMITQGLDKGFIDKVQKYKSDYINDRMACDHPIVVKHTLDQLFHKLSILKDEYPYEALESQRIKNMNDPTYTSLEAHAIRATVLRLEGKGVNVKEAIIELGLPTPLEKLCIEYHEGVDVAGIHNN